jgi:hypothetical protein
MRFMEGDVLSIRHLGPVSTGDFEFGDLTVLTGAQASGKSVVLQALKLAIDLKAVERRMIDHGLVWTNVPALLDLYFGDGMRALLTDSTAIEWKGQRVDLASVSGTLKRPLDEPERVGYIPAQRIMSIRDGSTRPFGEFRPGDPYVLREFSRGVHELVQGTLATSDRLFPRPQWFHDGLREVVSTHVLGGWTLDVDVESLQKRFVLRGVQADSDATLGFSAWSAGQREFVPLLLGLYRLMPAGAIGRRDQFDWCVIEEPEMGLHPRAIAATMAFVLELLRRGYRIALSTHSTQVLDVVWGLRRLSELGGSSRDVTDLLGIGGRHEPYRHAAEAALRATYRTYYLERGTAPRDISALDPLSEDPAESGWGGLTAFSDQVASVVARVVRRHEDLHIRS